MKIFWKRSRGYIKWWTKPRAGLEHGNQGMPRAKSACSPSLHPCNENLRDLHASNVQIYSNKLNNCFIAAEPSYSCWVTMATICTHVGGSDPSWTQWSIMLWGCSRRQHTMKVPGALVSFADIKTADQGANPNSLCMPSEFPAAPLKKQHLHSACVSKILVIFSHGQMLVWEKELPSVPRTLCWLKTTMILTQALISSLTLI